MAKPYKAEKKAYKKIKRKLVTPWKTLGIIFLVLTLILAPLNVVLGMFDNTISLLVAGNSFWELENRDKDAVYYPAMGVSQAERLEAGQALCYEVEAEGAALLLNNGALPLAQGAKVSTLSVNSVDLTYGGTGSGNVDASKADNLKIALEKSGFAVNATLWDWYNSEEAATLKAAAAEGGTQPWAVRLPSPKSILSTILPRSRIPSSPMAMLPSSPSPASAARATTAHSPAMWMATV